MTSEKEEESCRHLLNHMGGPLELHTSPSDFPTECPPGRMMSSVPVFSHLPSPSSPLPTPCPSLPEASFTAKSVPGPCCFVSGSGWVPSQVPSIRHWQQQTESTPSLIIATAQSNSILSVSVGSLPLCSG